MAKKEFSDPGIKSTKLFDKDPVAACDLAVKGALPDASDTSRFIPRKRLDASFRQFLGSPHSVFVLLGKAGAGREWALRHFMAQELGGRIRFLVRGSALDTADSLASLAKDTFADLSAGHLTKQEYLHILQAATTPDLGPLVIGIDNVPRFLQKAQDSLRRKLGRLTEQASRIGSKLVLTCNEETWELLGLGREMPPNVLFMPAGTDSSTSIWVPSAGQAVVQDGSQMTGSQANDSVYAAGPQVKGDGPIASYILGDLTLDELTDGLRRRLPANRWPATELQLRRLDVTLLRNAYLFDRYFDRHGSEWGLPDRQPTPVDVDRLLDERIGEQLQQVAEQLASDPETVQSTLDRLVQYLWSCRAQVTRQADAIRVLEESLPSQGHHALQTLRLSGLISASGSIEVCEKPMAVHLFAKNLRTRLARGEAIWSELGPLADGEIVTAAVRMSSDPVIWIEALVPREPRWVPSVARGLALCSPDSPRLVAALVGLTRPADDQFAEVDACRALGVLTARSALAWQWAKEMYFTETPMKRFESARPVRHHGIGSGESWEGGREAIAVGAFAAGLHVRTTQ